MPGCHDSAILARFLRVQLCHLLSFFRKRNGKWCDTDFADRHVCGLDSLLLLGSRKNSKTFNNNEKSNKNFCFSCWVLCEWDEVGRPKRPPSQGKKQQNLRVFFKDLPRPLGRWSHPLNMETAKSAFACCSILFFSFFFLLLDNLKN